MSGKHEMRRDAALPYINSFTLVLVVALINLPFALLHRIWGLSQNALLIDAAICGVTSSFICVYLAYWRMNKLRAAGRLPAAVPKEARIRRLSRKPLPLSLELSLAAGALMPLITYLVLRFFGIEDYPLSRFIVWKLVYSLILSAKLMELAVLRFAQEDCLGPEDPPQTGDAAIKNPLPKRETFANLFNTVTTDFGFNMLTGLLLGGTIISDYNVIIAPTTRAGIVISGAILGAIVALRMVYPVLSQIRGARDAGAVPPAAKRNRWIAWLPERPALFALTLAPLVIALSPLVFWAVFSFFGFEKLNFFQYFIVRTVYVALLTKPVVALAVLRYRQPASAGQRTR